MRCTKCGNEIADNAKFCGKCGNKVLKETQEFSSKEHVASENQNSEKQGMKPKKIIGIVAILIIAGISALLSGIFKIKNMEKNEAIISCGIEGSNAKVYEYNGKLKELNMSAKYNSVRYIREERFVVEENENRLIDINDKLIKSLNYQYVAYFREGLARVEADGKYGYIDKEGKEVVSPKYEDAGGFSEGLARVEADEKYGYIDKEGKEVVSPKYEGAGGFRGGLASVNVDGKWGYIDKEGKEVISPKYERSWYFGKNEESLRMSWGIVFGHDYDYDYDYDYEGEFSDGLIVVIKDGKAGVINQEGEVIIPTIYDYIYITRR